MLRELGQVLRIKRNFLVFFVVTTGIPLAAVLIWRFGELGGIYFKVLVVVVAMFGGFVGGLIMWKYFEFIYPGLGKKQDY